jgi:hypothetical protein
MPKIVIFHIVLQNVEILSPGWLCILLSLQVEFSFGFQYMLPEWSGPT